MLDDAFGHHVWATIRLLDRCLELAPEQLETVAQGTYGSILDTMRHLVGADASYLHVTSRGRSPAIDEEAMDLAALREVMAGHAEAWAAVLATEADPAEILVRHRDDGSSTAAPMSVRLAQALHHGTDHRSQICTALTSLGVEPPPIDVWDYAWEDGRLTETPPTS